MGRGPLTSPEPPAGPSEPSKEWGKATRTGILWSLGTFIGGRASTFITTLILARLLGPSEFGVVAAILIYLTLLELGSDLGMKATVVYEQEEGVTRRVQTAFTANVLIAGALTALGVIFAPAVAGFFGQSEDADLFRLAALSLILTGIGNIHDSLLLRDMDFRKRTRPLLGRAIVRGLVSIAMAVAGYGAVSLVVGMLAGAVTWTVLQWTATRFRPNFTLDLRIFGSMARYGSTAALLGLLALAATRADAITIGRVLGDKALGLYTIAFRIPELLIESVSINTSLVAFPALAKQRSIDRSALSEAAVRLLRFQALYSLPVGAGLSVLATPLVVTLFSAEWKEAGAVMSAVALVSAVYTLTFPLGEVFRAIGKQWILVTLNVIQLPILITAIIVVADDGIVTVAWVRGLGVLLHVTLTTICVMAVLDISLRRLWSALAPGLVAGIGVGVGALAVRWVWPADNIGPVILGSLVGGTLGLAVLRTVAPDAFEQVVRQAGSMVPIARLRRVVGVRG